MIDITARLLYVLAASVTRLPWRWLASLGDMLATRMVRRGAREARVIMRNLELAYPELGPGQRMQLRETVMRTTIRQAFETLRLWTRSREANLALIREQHGTDLFDAALARGRGLIVAAPHYGNWELLNQWLAARTPLAILYAPPDSKVVEAFLNRVRSAHGAADRVRQVRAADGPQAVRQLLRQLKEGGVVGILPDQQPKQGEGEFAPFFGLPALTMSLLPRLAAKTGATVVMAYCERISGGDHDREIPTFALRVEAAPDAIAHPDPAVGTAALNAAVEAIARRDPTQYQWTYKRYSLQPGDAGNPYWPDCY